MMGAKLFVPMVIFYPNTGIYGSSQDITFDLKNSLSQTLTKYYPFAGRYTNIAPAHVDCNDDGAEFLVASIDTTLSDFLQNSQHEDLYQFVPYNQIWFNSNRRDKSNQVIPLAVQVNHFECGGVAVAVSLSHRIADGLSLVHFLNDWAKMTRFCSQVHKHADFPIEPQFVSFQNINTNFDGFKLASSNDCVTRSFMFPNSKINDLKHKVKAMIAGSGQPMNNPTRIEGLIWLLYKCAVEAATKNNSGSFKPTRVYQPINIRRKMIELLPEMSIGNFILLMEIITKKESETKPESFIIEFQKQKKQFQGLRNIETACGLVSNMLSKPDLEEQKIKILDAYASSSLCGSPTYEIDFGWGKPVKSTIIWNIKNSFVLMDAPNGDGIEALVCLEKQDMATIQRDHELLAFCTPFSNSMQ